jgi:hypothetical protein
MTTLTDLIERLERAEGPSRELDEAIWRKFGGSVILVEEVGGHTHRRWMDSDNVRWAESLTKFTESINNALQLVSGALDWDLKTAKHRRGYVALIFNPQRTHRADARTPATAICVAALKAAQPGEQI